MQIGSEEPPPARLSPRVALMSIAGFWAFYFAITTARAVAFGYDNQFELLFRRAAVALVSMGLSYIFYLLLRGNPTASLKRTMVLAAFIAIPAAIIAPRGEPLMYRMDEGCSSTEAGSVNRGLISYRIK